MRKSESGKSRRSTVNHINRKFECRAYIENENRFENNDNKYFQKTKNSFARTFCGINQWSNIWMNEYFHLYNNRKQSSFTSSKTKKQNFFFSLQNWNKQSIRTLSILRIDWNIFNQSALFWFRHHIPINHQRDGFDYTISNDGIAFDIPSSKLFMFCLSNNNFLYFFSFLNKTTHCKSILNSFHSIQMDILYDREDKRKSVYH